MFVLSFNFVESVASLQPFNNAWYVRAECVSIFQTRIEVYVEATDSRLIAEKLVLMFMEVR